MELKGTVAIVTGSTRGIGKAIALELGIHGAKLVLSGRNEEAAKAVADELKKSGIEFLIVTGDVSKYSDAQNLIEKTLEKFTRIDFLINNAGITRDNLLLRMTEEEWDTVIDTNLKGSYNCIRASAKTFMKQRSGRIINITSVVGQIGNAGQANYAASKAGIIGLTKSVARELASRNILVNAIAPGFIETDMTANLPEKAREGLMNSIPLGRLGSPEEVARVAMFLCSPAAAYMTGQVINVDGGMVM